MVKELEYPFDAGEIIKNKKKIKRRLLETSSDGIPVKIAVLGGSTTRDIILCLELFLLDYGIKPRFYESEYGKYWEDAMFPSEKLKEFEPDIVYIHTTNRNIQCYPLMDDSREEVQGKLQREYQKLEQMWKAIGRQFKCQVIQNNFDQPTYRLLGNQDCYDFHGKNYFIHCLNGKIYEYAQDCPNFHINDLHWLASSYGIDKWAAPFYWDMYKYAVSVPAIPYLSFNLANIIKSIYGKNKKSLVLDLDNTLWGGVIGDEGVDKIKIGNETPEGQMYLEFQQYIKELKTLGIILNINSKNDYENAIEGLNHPEGILKPDDFFAIKANWNPKYQNLLEISKEMGILPESMVFVDDNPAEREAVSSQFSKIAVPKLAQPEDYIFILDRSGFFEVTSFSADDKNRVKMYEENQMRSKAQAEFTDYSEFLKSLEMKAVIRPFEKIYFQRIAQLTNKTNQFNLTTKRYSLPQVEAIAANDKYITLYGKMSDKFGDNGLISVIIGSREGGCLHVELWIMSCRVLKRDMELAMMDALVKECQSRGITRIIGYYYPTQKNSMVKELYRNLGFSKVEEDEKGNTVWEFSIPASYSNKNKQIFVEDRENGPGRSF